VILDLAVLVVVNLLAEVVDVARFFREGEVIAGDLLDDPVLPLFLLDDPGLDAREFPRFLGR
jgi:hypothetical protein